ncbi:2-hydroxyacid dehydrogenase [Paracoccus sediminicola]|uniref:2-hydroxyacid dehydrogenase n=1 Tax=Paracoccus sediminicola TaxID=3017783 RepID=UPI0022F09779|nr:glyoxylate/hydroxypyruvate reductase A [Paracoccus sediminicola]WBU55539.1 glyoxylate/hydroxypyruvate reductase A [Paracoccus sediminicola]
MRVLFAADGWDVWAPALREACPEMELVQDAAADSVDAIIYAPNGGGCDFAAYPSAKLVQSLWAGVERIAPDETLTQPLARMVDPSLEQGMVEFCAGWTLRLHLEMDRFAQDGRWRNEAVPPLASARRVTVFGAGALGGAVAKALRRLGFDVATWSASGRSTGDIPALAGQDFDAALARSDIAILLLPDTAGTRDLFDAEAIARMPEGAALINPGRGTLIDDGALIAALDRGHLRHAVLDVFRTEPLPEDHPFWSHDNITVTPHIAAATRPETGAPVAAENIRRAMRGETPLHLVDRSRGY